MESATLKNINQILKDAPENILERILGYLEGILEEENSGFKLLMNKKKVFRNKKKII